MAKQRSVGGAHKHPVYTHGKGVKHHSKMIHHPGRDKHDFHGNPHVSKAKTMAPPPMAPPQMPAGGPPDMADNDAPGAGI